ncbi:MAG: biotin--[acetyl-CoA-carboxylase] ligase [Phycisphaerales bacterium]
MTRESNNPEEWRRALGKDLLVPGGMISRVEVVEQTSSTMQEAREFAGASPGVAVIAMRQLGGRGRLGRRWLDERGEGLAMTLALPASLGADRIAVGTGIAVCVAMERLGVEAPRLRWPNDVLADDRKLCGILIETSGDIAFTGIGLNVHQREWPAPLEGVAISLAELGVETDRVRVASEIVRAAEETLSASHAALIEQFRRYDLLIGARAEFEAAGRRFSGEVLDIDPFRGLKVRTMDGVIHLDARTTSVLHRHADRRV